MIRLEPLDRPMRRSPASPVLRAGCGPLTFAVPVVVSVRASLAPRPQTVAHTPDSPIEVPARQAELDRLTDYERSGCQRCR